MNRRRLLVRILSGSADVSFDDMLNLVEGFGSRLSRVAGSRTVFVHPDIPELVNLQSVGGEAKPYQVRRFLRLVERHDLQLRSG